MYDVSVKDMMIYPLSHYYAAFLVLMSLHFLVVLGLKQLLVPTFRKYWFYL